MVSTEEIGARAYEMLSESLAGSITGVVDWERTDYTKEDIIIVPHSITGEGSFPRFGQININIHVPDPCTIPSTGEPIYNTNFPRLVELRKMCIEVLKSHYESGEGWNWTIGMLNPPIKEPDHNEHFVSLALEITARDKN